MGGHPGQLCQTVAGAFPCQMVVVLLGGLLYPSSWEALLALLGHQQGRLVRQAGGHQGMLRVVLLRLGEFHARLVASSFQEQVHQHPEQGQQGLGEPG